MVTKSLFGKTSQGEDVYAYRITNNSGIAVTVLDYGATLQSVVLPHNDEPVDIVLGYDTIQEYEQNDGYLGASVGRYAGRIPDSVLHIGEKDYPLAQNDGRNHLHGGKFGFDKRIWSAKTAKYSVTFRLLSPDGDENYPGNLNCSATYTLTNRTLKLTYRASADAVTAWNPTNHAYWNLNGHASGDVRSAHLLQIPASRYVPVGSDMIPTDHPRQVFGTVFDFRMMRAIRDCYDHSFTLDEGAIWLCGSSGICMSIITDCKAVQLYTANFLSDRKGKGGVEYHPYGAVCLETESRQVPQDSTLPEESILLPNAPVSHTTKFHFLFK